MAKINIPTIKGGFNLSKINDAFQSVEDHLNEKVLYRDVPEGEPNQLENDLDMNGKRVYNLPVPEADSEPITKGYLEEYTDKVRYDSALRVADAKLPPVPSIAERKGKFLTFDEQGNPEVRLPADDSATQLRYDLTDYNGEIEGEAEWTEVPAHRDSGFDLQAQALANQAAFLKLRIDELPAEVDAAGTADAKVRSHDSDPEAHPEMHAFISAEADRAEAARDAAIAAAGPLYATIAEGRAAVANGDTFAVEGAGAVAATIYRRTSASAQAQIAELPSLAALDSKVSREELEEKASVEKIINDDLLFAIADKYGNATWLSASAEDGGMPAHSEKEVRKKLRLDEAQSSRILYAVTDENGFLTDLSIDRETGQLMEFVVKRLASRIKDYLGIQEAHGVELNYANMDLAQSVKGKDFYVRDGAVMQARADSAKWACWGSSSMQGIGPYLSTLAGSYGSTLYQGGKNSEHLDQTAARLGSHKAKVTFPDNTIPASGAVAVTVSNVVPRSTLKTYTGTISGVSGTLSSNDAGFTFARATAGDSVFSPPDSEFIPEFGALNRGSVTFLNLGKNTLTTAAGSDELVIKYTDEAFSWLAPMFKRAFVIGHFCNTNSSPTSAGNVRIHNVNEYQKAKYGDLYIDVSGYITSPQVWIDTGITPTSADLTQQANGNKPPSLSADNGHLNEIGYLAVVNNLIKPRIDSFGWY